MQDQDGVHATNGTVAASPSSSLVERNTDHTIRFDTWVGYNSTWKYFKVRPRGSQLLIYSPSRLLTCDRDAAQMWADEYGASFAMEKAKIEGRAIEYPLLLNANAEPMLESTNAFLEWFCSRCESVTKKSVVEKAVSWLKACADLARDKRGKGVLEKGVFTSRMCVRVAIQEHAKAHGLHAIASGKEVAARADNLLTYDQMTAMVAEFGGLSRMRTVATQSYYSTTSDSELQAQAKIQWGMFGGGGGGGSSHKDTSQAWKDGTTSDTYTQGPTLLTSAASTMVADLA